MILLTEDASVTLELSGNRVDLNKLNRENIYITVDASKLMPSQTEYRVDIRYPDNVSSDAFTVEGQYPSVIKLDVAWRGEKTVKVDVEFNADAIPSGYGYLTPELEFSEVEIVGPEDVVNQISVAKVKLELNENNNKTGILDEEFKLTFCDEEGNPVDSSHVRVAPDKEMITISLPIYMKKVIPLKLYVKEGGGATAENNVTISPEEITVLGSEEALADIHEWYVNTEENALDLATVEAGVISFEIKDLPDGITNRSGTDTANVTVNFDNLDTQVFTLSIDDVEQILPEGLYPEISENQIMVTVRGTKERMKNFRQSQILAVLDFTGAKMGQPELEWSVQLSIDGGPYQDVGVISRAQVLVEIKDISEKPPEEE